MGSFVKGLVLLCLVAAGCNAGTRYTVLSSVLDGVPKPKPPAPAPSTPAGSLAALEESRRVGGRGHGPYEAKECTACHKAGALSEFVVPRDQLCFRCHDFKIDKRYVHGPLASGGCTACHDPHGSKYRYLLVAASDSFCLRCHDPQLLARNAKHAGVTEQCTQCHDAHMSDKRYLLR